VARPSLTGRVFLSAVLLAALGNAGCTSSPEKDMGATAVGTGAGVLVCVVTLFACPVALAVGAGSGLLVRKANVSQTDECMRRTAITDVREREAYCKRR
jgi:hypothetical protein